MYSSPEPGIRTAHGGGCFGSHTTDRHTLTILVMPYVTKKTQKIFWDLLPGQNFSLFFSVFSDAFFVKAFGLFQGKVNFFSRFCNIFLGFCQKKPLFFQVFQDFQVWPYFSRFSRCGGNPAQAGSDLAVEQGRSPLEAEKIQGPFFAPRLRTIETTHHTTKHACTNRTGRATRFQSDKVNCWATKHSFIFAEEAINTFIPSVCNCKGPQKNNCQCTQSRQAALKPACCVHRLYFFSAQKCT